MALRRAYLIAYNAAQFLGWATALVRLLPLVSPNLLDTAYLESGKIVGTFQLLAALEIIHAAVGLVGGSPVTALMQWAGRSNVLFGVIRSVPEVQNRVTVGVLFLSWALSEMVRYPWYVATLAGCCPGWLTWLRYTAFIVLYPVGVLAEIKSVWDALPLINLRGLHSIRLPNTWNFGFDYHTFLVVLLVLYPFLWLQLYLFLFKQRAKKLGGKHATAKAV